MSVVAVAGGTGKLGRAIVDALISNGTHQVFILARKQSDSLEKEIGVRILEANYADSAALTTLLESNRIGTVISTLHLQGFEQELALIKAADRSSTTKRYIPSIWGVKYTEHILLYFPMAKAKIDILSAIEATTLEWTAILNGYFLDYFVAPKVKSYMSPMALVLDSANDTAAIPGSGDVPVVFTHTFDVARFVVALLTKSSWHKESYIIGDRVTWNEFLRLVEEAKGTNFTVVHDSMEKLRSGQVTELPSHAFMYTFYPKELLQRLFSAFGIMFEEGDFNFKPSRSLNDEFPDITPRSVKELVAEAWKSQ